MNQPTDAHKRERVEPDELHNPLPVWYSLISVAFVIWGMVYFYQQIGGLPGAGDHRTAIVIDASATVDGKSVYAANCSSCHQATGQGIPGAFPPLDGSLWVTESHEVATQILLHGVNGEMVVKGTPYKGAMPTMSHLADTEIAAVLSYIRSSWSNQSDAVTASQVETQRKLYAADRGPWAGGQQLLDTLGISITGDSSSSAASDQSKTTQSSPATQASATTPSNTASSLNGETLYNTNCGACHQATGKGLPGAFPPLDGSRWVTGSSELSTQIVLHGITGEMVVQGTTYNGAMPAMGHLSDAQIAEVLSYIRSSWSNQSTPVSKEDVQAQRARFDAGRGAWAGAQQLLDTLELSLEP